ncbi:hypothetical protein H9Q69_008514 [Fusarium xylarioides]|nr:hypothetical protein H9Q69_008514 [Fusarium xylarioides]
MNQSHEPSYLLAGFPSEDDRMGAHENKDPNATEMSLKSPNTPASGGSHGMPNEERGFGRKFMPGRVLADCTATLVPIALLASAIAMMCLDKKQTEKEESGKWKNAITVIASIFPIVFASIVGRMVFESARWKLEKGTTLDLLEQLIGSRTVGSTFTTQISLGKVNILGIVLLLVWAFSPLGSQSILRMLDTRLEQVNTDSDVAYFSTDAESRVADPLPASPQSSAGQARDFGNMNSMFTSLFLPSRASKSSPMDLWGNVKIPNLDITDDGWHDVPSNPDPDSYSALIGLPITNVTTGNVTFSIDSSYLNLACYNLTRANTTFNIPHNWTNPTYWGTYVPKPNGTWYGYNRSLSQDAWSLAVDRFVDPYWATNGNLANRFENYNFGVNYYGRPVLFENETDLHVEPSRLLFNSEFTDRVNAAANGFTAECHVFQRYVESRVHCSRVDMSTSQNCSVAAQRLSRTKHATENITALSWERVWSRVSGLPGIMGGSALYADITMRYLDNPVLNAVTNQGLEENTNLFKDVTPEQFSRRLAQVINTYLLLGQVFETAMQADSNFNFNITAPAKKLGRKRRLNW